jgi:hypothetical protein
MAANNAAADAALQAIQDVGNAQADLRLLNLQPIPQPLNLSYIYIYIWPGMANIQALDYTKSSYIKMFLSGIEALSSKFELQADQLKVFLECLKERERMFDWSFVVTVPDNSNTNRNLINKYGRLTIENCQAHEMTFVAVPGRNAQNSLISRC